MGFKITKFKRRMRKLLILILVVLLIFGTGELWFGAVKEKLNNEYTESKEYFSNEITPRKEKGVVETIVDNTKEKVGKINENDVKETVGNVIDKGSDLLEKSGEKITDLWEENIDKVVDFEKEETSERETTDTFEKGVLYPAKLIAVIDGDTLLVDYENTTEKVRLIGINTPESVHENEELNTIYGTYASDYTKSVLNDYIQGTIYLEFDEEPRDEYGRLLAYVWLNEDTSILNIEHNLLNMVIVGNGYAEPMAVEPNTKIQNLFELFYTEAKNESLGLWQYEDFNLFE